MGLSWKNDFTGIAQGVASSVESMGETGKSFRESWAQRLTDADMVTENDVISLYADFRPEVAARASSGYLAAREEGDKRLVLDHATSDVAANLMVAAKAAVESYEGLRNNTNTSNTALAQSQVAGTVTQGNLTAAMAQLMAYQAAKAAAADYEREIARRQELARWLEAHQRRPTSISPRSKPGWTPAASAYGKACSSGFRRSTADRINNPGDPCKFNSIPTSRPISRRKN